MEDTSQLLELIRAQPDSEVEWTLHNVENAVLVDIIMELLELLKTYQVKYNDME